MAIRFVKVGCTARKAEEELEKFPDEDLAGLTSNFALNRQRGS
jgi:hypothetical protein